MNTHSTVLFQHIWHLDELDCGWFVNKTQVTTSKKIRPSMLCFLVAYRINSATSLYYLINL